jgi:hypothetical protein
MRVFISIALTILSAAILKTQTLQVATPNVSSAAEVKRTVDAISGVWKGQMTADVPGSPPGSIDWTMDCKRVALNSGALCTNGGTAPFGELAESCLFAFDPESKAVHYMCVTSMGEVHDHKGKWTDAKTIEFEPLRAGMMGKQVIETLKWRFDDDGTIDKTSEVKLADGSMMQFHFKGKRVS